MKTLLTIACLGILLGLPFAVREGAFSKRAEPYPAVLFPVGDHKINLQDATIPSTKVELFSRDAKGEEHKLPPAKFFHPIPSVYWPHIASEKSKFGLANPTDDKVKKTIGAWQLTLIKKRTATELEKQEVAHWMTARLDAVGRPQDRTIIIRNTTTNIDTNTGDKLDSEINFEYEIQLDDY